MLWIRLAWAVRYGRPVRNDWQPKHPDNGLAQVTVNDVGNRVAVHAPDRANHQDGTKRHDPASCDTGSDRKRVKGVEPSTFTLAT